MGIRRHLRILAAVLLVGLCGGPAAAYEEIRGFALVEDVDPVARTITLRGSVFAVSPRAELLDAEGKRVQLRDLEDLEVQRINEFMIASDGRGVFFEAIVVRGENRLQSLQVVNEIPH